MRIDSGQKRTSTRRRDILDASLRCFMRHGVEASTIEQIREASGASSGSIYHHFGSKQAIAIALYVEGQEQLASLYCAAMSRQAAPEKGIRAILKSYFRWVSEHRDWALYLLRVATADIAAHDETAIHDINRRIREDLECWMRPFIERGEIIRLPAELYASLVFGAATHYARHWLAGRLTLDLDKVLDPLSEATWRALCAKPISPQTSRKTNRSAGSRITSPHAVSEKKDLCND